MGKTTHTSEKKVKKRVNKCLDYNEKRQRNNEAIKKNREKARAMREETERQMSSLRTENEYMERRIQLLKDELEFLKYVYYQHTQTAPAEPDINTNTEHIQSETMQTEEDDNDDNIPDKKDHLLKLINEIQILNNSV